MSFKSTPLLLAALIGTALTTPLHASDSSLVLPRGASIGVEVIESVHVEGEQARLSDILLHPAPATNASHALPEYCLLVANIQLSGERLRITTQDATCIETYDSESAIYSGSFKASAYADNGQYGLACDAPTCSLEPGTSFILTLDESVSITAQDNPSAEINARRRQANGEGVANPIPADRPTPSESSSMPSNSAQ